MRRRARATALVVIGALVATTTCASQADYGPEALDPPELVYVHDALGRLHLAGDPEGEAAVYRYDAVGTIEAVERMPSDELAVIDVVPRRARPGDEVVVSGTGFDERRSRNTVTFDERGASAEAEAVEAEVVEAGRFELTVVVPEGATSGPVRVEAARATASGATDFVVEPDRRPVVERVSPTTVGAGDEVRVAGRNFTGDPLLDLVVIGGTTYATVTSATETSLVATVPPTAPSGRVSVATPYGTDRSDETLVVAPLGYPAAAVGGLTRTELGGEAVELSLSDPDGEGSVELVAFEGRRGEAVSLSLAASGSGPGSGPAEDRLTCSDVTIGLSDPTGVELVDPRAPVVDLDPDDPWCSDTEDSSRPIVLPATGLYTLTIEPRGPRTGSVAIALHEADPPTPANDPDAGRTDNDGPIDSARTDANDDTGSSRTDADDEGAAGATSEGNEGEGNDAADDAGAALTTGSHSGAVQGSSIRALAADATPSQGTSETAEPGRATGGRHSAAAQDARIRTLSADATPSQASREHAEPSPNREPGEPDGRRSGQPRVPASER